MNGRATAAWLAVALAVWVGATLYFRRQTTTAGPSWQRHISELSPAQRRFETTLRQEIGLMEASRSETHSWPPLQTFNDWRLLQQGVYVNYVGPGEGLRWLVLIIEPDKTQPSAGDLVPLDDEHHQLGDGTQIHVTVWVQPLHEPSPVALSPFPAAEGWVEIVRKFRPGGSR